MEITAGMVKELRNRTGVGMMKCKAALKESLIKRLAPVATRRKALAADPSGVDTVLARGAEAAREVASRTLEQVRRMMKIER